MEMITTRRRRFHAFLIENRSAVKTPGMGNLLAKSQTEKQLLTTEKIQLFKIVG